MNFLIDLGGDEDVRLVTRSSMPVLLQKSDNNTANVVEDIDCAAILREAIAAKRGNRLIEYENKMRQLVDYFAQVKPARSPAEVRRDFGLIDIGNTPTVPPPELRFLDLAVIDETINTPMDISQSKLNPSPVAATTKP